jgi:hypothetical protein
MPLPLALSFSSESRCHLSSFRRKKRRNEKAVTAYAYMIRQALEFTRYGIEAGHANAAELAESVRKRLLALGEGGQVRRVASSFSSQISRYLPSIAFAPGDAMPLLLSVPIP